MLKQTSQESFFSAKQYLAILSLCSDELTLLKEMLIPQTSFFIWERKLAAAKQKMLESMMTISILFLHILTLTPHKSCLHWSSDPGLILGIEKLTLLGFFFFLQETPIFRCTCSVLIYVKYGPEQALFLQGGGTMSGFIWEEEYLQAHLAWE